MESSEAVDAYLGRIGVDRQTPDADLETLRLLQRKHLLAVPFENLDIHWKRPIVLDTARFYEKIVRERRGGFCYELNGLFDELLISLGFETRLVSARVFNGSGHGTEFDHAAILVRVGDEEYLADVGFGDFAAGPLRVGIDAEQHDAAGTFVIRKFDDEYLEVAKRDGREWKSEYIFKNIPRSLSDFAEMCDFQQSSPDSHFTKGKLCSIMTEGGRKTLTDLKFIVTAGEVKTEKGVDSPQEFDRLLNDEFGIRRIQ